MAHETLEQRNAQLTQQDRAHAQGVTAGEHHPDALCPFGEGPLERAWRKGFRLGQQLRARQEIYR